MSAFGTPARSALDAESIDCLAAQPPEAVASPFASLARPFFDKLTASP